MQINKLFSEIPNYCFKSNLIIVEEELKISLQLFRKLLQFLPHFLTVKDVKGNEGSAFTVNS